MPWRAVIGTVLPVLQARGDPAGAEGRALDLVHYFVVGEFVEEETATGDRYGPSAPPGHEGFLAGLAGLAGRWLTMISCQDRQRPLKRAGVVVEHSRHRRVAAPELPLEAAVSH